MFIGILKLEISTGHEQANAIYLALENCIRCYSAIHDNVIILSYRRPLPRHVVFFFLVFCQHQRYCLYNENRKIDDEVLEN